MVLRFFAFGFIVNKTKNILDLFQDLIQYVISSEVEKS